MARKGIWLLLAAFTWVGCTDGGSARPKTGASAPSGSASAPTFTRGAPSGAPSGTATEASASAPEPSASANAAADDGPLPDVEVTNIGMHIGGEENTAAQKKPIREAVHKHYDAFRRCYGKLASPPEEATFGVDMRIAKTGGPAKITNPRNTFDDDTITPCLISVFEAVEFAKPKKGIDQMVSFSLRFRRK
ncbi:MAG: hypothetical protein JRI68_35810 [Deltaproteobacteria bacterium]|nr:hypothetical protein [Deltaproteobacteria bacterium]